MSKALKQGLSSRLYKAFTLPVDSSYISLGYHIYNPVYPGTHGWNMRVRDLVTDAILAERYTAQSSGRGQNYDIRFRLRRLDNTDWLAGDYIISFESSGEGDVVISSVDINQSSAGAD